MLLGDTSTVWKCFRPAPFYITIQNPSQIDFDFEFDEVSHGKRITKNYKKKLNQNLRTICKPKDRFV